LLWMKIIRKRIGIVFFNLIMSTFAYL